MYKIFISGSRCIKQLDNNILEKLDNIINYQYTVILGDADGVDSSVQSYLKDKDIETVTVYCTGSQPRNNFGDWPTNNVQTDSKPGTRAYYTAKDLKMAEDCHYGLMIWDARSPGTLSNAVELLQRNKKSWIYINKVKKFVKLKQVDDIQTLLSFMSNSALKKADSKIGLFKKVESLRFSQSQLLELT